MNDKVIPLSRTTERFVTRRELARIMGVGERTVARWVTEGCPSETWGQRSRRFLPSEVVEWARRRSEAA
jgi:phage terminase Nu1 subunit (DNA packaging protein)